MRVAFSGSRGFTDVRLVEAAVDRINKPKNKILIPCSDRGCTKGVDTFVHVYADHLADTLAYEVFYAEWKRYGKRAGFLRNEDMIRKADMLVAFLADGAPSPGTTHAIKLAQEKGIAMYVYHEGSWTSVPSIHQ